MKYYKLLAGAIFLVLGITGCSNAANQGSSGAANGAGITVGASGTVAQGSSAGANTVPTNTISDGSSTGSSATGNLLPPVETEKANTDYQPAFQGQTRAPGLKTETSFTSTIITSNLNAPWSVKEISEGRFAVTEKAGVLRIVTKDGGVSAPIAGFPELDSGGQGGLLDVLPDLEFSSNRILYFTLSEETQEGSLTAVGKGRLSEDETKLENFSIIYRAIPYFKGSNHFGSRIIFDENGNLIVTTGERQSTATREKAQTLDNGYGKVMRITTDGREADGNPFIGQTNALPEILSYGHRNPQGLAIHPETNDIWISEMGPRGGDELNWILSGKNYGWPVVSYGIEYSGQKIGEGITIKEGTEQPVYYWDPVLAPSGMTFYSSDKIPEWKNNLFIGGLAGQHIARIVLDGNRVVGEERLLEGEGQRFRDITQGSDGALYAVTDAGRLYRIGR